MKLKLEKYMDSSDLTLPNSRNQNQIITIKNKKYHTNIPSLTLDSISPPALSASKKLVRVDNLKSPKDEVKTTIRLSNLRKSEEIKISD